MLLGDEGTVYTPIPPEGTPGELHAAPAMVSSPKRDKEGQFDPQNRFVFVEPVYEGLACGASSELNRFEQALANEIVHFVECCQEGKEPISGGRDNLGTMKIILGIYESSRIGEMVDLSTL